MSAPFTFVLPPELSAKEPPERRGIRRDQVRLMVIDRASKKLEHTRFDKIQITCAKAICWFSIRAELCRQQCAVANVVNRTGPVWKYAWLSVCRTIHGWRSCCANKGIPSAADCGPKCKFNSVNSWRRP